MGEASGNLQGLLSPVSQADVQPRNALAVKVVLMFQDSASLNGYKLLVMRSSKHLCPILHGRLHLERAHPSSWAHVWLKPASRGKPEIRLATSTLPATLAFKKLLTIEANCADRYWQTTQLLQQDTRCSELADAQSNLHFSIKQQILVESALRW